MSINHEGEMVIYLQFTTSRQAMTTVSMSTFFDQTDEDYDDSKYESIIDFSSDFDRNISDDSTDTNVRPTSKTMIEVLENVKADDGE
ncbi:hypothetical protein PVK06_003392 [Gossypium arboreum]|uniref:Uncharacterized protein n=1 Tax=Gossypium arboreum TaxID=29729 RepID=A0ABR0R664_GOSAR|nr:hypothetical protein PVK06_003392 [Gossypium arboreum]